MTNVTTKGKVAVVENKEHIIGDYIITNGNAENPNCVCVIRAISMPNNSESIFTVKCVGGDPRISGQLWNVLATEFNEASLVVLMHKGTKKFVKSIVRDEITGEYRHLETAELLSKQELAQYAVIAENLLPRTMAITIDGPASAGKSTMAKYLQKRLGNHWLCVDTGAFYRALSVAILKRCGGSIPHGWLNDVYDMRLSAKYDYATETQIMCVNNVELTEEELRNEQISQIASKISTEKDVRTIVNKAVNDYAKGKKVIIEGRDTGSVIIPDAKVKFYLTANQEERAKRRCLQINSSKFDDILNDIKERDERDLNRIHDPLTIPAGAIYIDSTTLEEEQTADLMYKITVNLLKKEDSQP